MTTKSGQNRAGLTVQSVRQGMFTNGSQLTPAGDPLLTASRVTRRYSPRARKCARKGCDVVFKPKAKHGKFCSDACRKADARRKAQKGMKPKAADPVLVVCECQWCGNTFFAEQGRAARWCSNSHKELAYRQRCAATIEALMGDLNEDEQQAVEQVERMGMKRCGAYLRGAGYIYDERARAWLLPVGAGVTVDAL